MFDARLDRRHFLGGAGAIGAATLLPTPIFAREGWSASTAVLNDYVGRKTIAGGVIAVGRSTSDPVFRAAGRIAIGAETAADADTLWRIYSMTKPITGMAAMILIGEKKLGLDQPIADFLPAYKAMRVCTNPDTSLETVPAKTQITVRHLLTHTAGLGYTIVTKGPLLQEYIKQGINPALVSRFPIPGVPQVPTAPSLAEFADRLAGLPLAYEPGTLWSYSVSIDLLGRVIELASGQAFDAFLQARLFDPLGMKDTFFTVPADKVARLSTSYALIGTSLIPVDTGAQSIYLDKPPFAFGGSGLVSSARDYDRFLAMLIGKGTLGGKAVMAPEMVALGMSNLLPPGASTGNGYIKGQGFGAGGRVKTTADATPSGIGTYGWGGAAGTIAWVDPTHGIRASGYSQYLPEEAQPFAADVGKAIYADIA